MPLKKCVRLSIKFIFWDFLMAEQVCETKGNKQISNKLVINKSVINYYIRVASRFAKPDR